MARLKDPSAPDTGYEWWCPVCKQVNVTVRLKDVTCAYEDSCGNHFAEIPPHRICSLRFPRSTYTRQARARERAKGESFPRRRSAVQANQILPRAHRLPTKVCPICHLEQSKYQRFCPDCARDFDGPH